MNFNTLRYVVAIAQERSFTLAAKRLHISQPSLSQSIKSLEERLGVILFDRTTIPLETTSAGKEYVEWAQQVLLSEAHIYRHISDIRTSGQVQLRVGIPPHRSAFMLPQIIQNVLQEFPSCAFFIEDGVQERELYDLLYDRQIDLMIGAAHPDETRFKNVFITNERILLAVPKSYLLMRPEKDEFPPIGLSVLRDKPFIIMPASTYLGRLLRNLCEQEGFLPAYSIVSRNVFTTLNMVDIGLGCALVPELVVKYDLPRYNVDYFTLSNGSPSQDVSILTRSDAVLTEPVRRFKELVLQHYGT